MIVTLTGPNSFGLQTRLHQLTDDFIYQYGELGVERIDGQEAELARMTESLYSLPFLSARKLIILRAASSNKQFSEQAPEILKSLPETNQVIIIESKLDKRLGYYKYLKQATSFEEFPELDQNGLTRWLTDTAKAQKGSISQSDAYYLVQRIGPDQQMLSSELDKLMLYKPEVSRETINLLTDATPQSTIFELLESAFAGNIKKCLQLYEEQRALKVEPQQIIAMLAWQLHILAVIKTAGERSDEVIAKEAKISPFVVRKSQSIANKITLSRLKQLVADLLRLDQHIKSISIDADEALQHYLLKLA